MAVKQNHFISQWERLLSKQYANAGIKRSVLHYGKQFHSSGVISETGIISIWPFLTHVLLLLKAMNKKNGKKNSKPIIRNFYYEFLKLQIGNEFNLKMKRSVDITTMTS